MDRRTLLDWQWACPACEEGWQQYLIATDMNVCPMCGYKGGDPQKHKQKMAKGAEKVE